MNATVFATDLILDNQSNYPTGLKHSKMMVQWAFSGKDIDAAHRALMNGDTLDSRTLKKVSSGGSIHLSIPDKAEYFRVLVWSQKSDTPELQTNWVEIVPEKTYVLRSEHLIPSVLMFGTGC